MSDAELLATKSRTRRALALAALIALVGAVAAIAIGVPYCVPPVVPTEQARAAEPPATEASDGRASILFVGDTYFGESYSLGPRRYGLLQKRGYGYPFARLRALLQSADQVVANLEAPLSASRASPLEPHKQYVHCGAPDPSAAALAAAGIDVVSLANNHAMDLLERGLEDTTAALSAHGIAFFGAGRSLAEAARPYRHELRVGTHRFRLAVISAFERDWPHWHMGFYAHHRRAGAYGLWARTIARQIRALKAAEPELFVVVFPHWGPNYAWRTAEQARLGRAMIDAGADLVVGHGAHVFQEVERYGGRWILYGIGNFAFLSPGRYGKRDIHPYGMPVRLELSDRGDELAMTLALYFVASDNRKTRFRPHLLDGEDFERAARTLLDGGELEPAARAALREAARRKRDAVGPYLALDLGQPATPPR